MGRQVALGAGLFLGLFVVANVAYAVKSLSGVNLDPGGDTRHHGAWFPLGGWLYRALKRP